MPRSPRRENPDEIRFLAFSCYRRLNLLKNPAIADLFAERLASERTRLRFRLIGWVVMPNHVHLLVWPRPPDAGVRRILHAIKQPFAQRVIARWTELEARLMPKITDRQGKPHFWLAGGGYDRNIALRGNELREKLNYIHMNPVRKGLVAEAIEWKWSSARWYAGIREGELEIDPLRRPE